MWLSLSTRISWYLSGFLKAYLNYIFIARFGRGMFELSHAHDTVLRFLPYLAFFLSSFPYLLSSQFTILYSMSLPAFSKIFVMVLFSHSEKSVDKNRLDLIRNTASFHGWVSFFKDNIFWPNINFMFERMTSKDSILGFQNTKPL